MSFFKRMGSAPSSSTSIKPVAIHQIDGCDSRGSSGRSRGKLDKGKEVTELNEKLTNVQVLLDQARQLNSTYELDVKQLSDEVEQLKADNESLSDQNQTLEERLGNIDASLSEPSFHTEISESLKLKEQEVVKLQTEIQAAQGTIDGLRQKYKSKLKSFRADSGKKRQESSMKMFELKDEISRLQEENEKLKGKLKSTGYTSHDSDDDSQDVAESSSPVPDGRSNIIIELSTQISDQEHTISTLESRLAEKDKIIERLNVGKLSPRDAKNIIEIEADKANQEMHALAKELKMLKRKKKRSKPLPHDLENNNDFDIDRELSSLSRDSGAVDMTSSSRNSRKTRQRATDNTDSLDSFSLLTPSPLAASYTSPSSLVT